MATLKLKTKPALSKSGNNDVTPAMAKHRDEQASKPPAGNKPLHTLYRPSVLSEVVGQGAVTKSLAKLLKGSSIPHAYLFTGPSGCGKTTLARIIAHELGIGPESIIEIDAASNSGIADMRLVVDNVRYRSMAGNGAKFVIVDEAHALSKQTWQSLLKPIEEPPAHVYWVLCTTEPDKVPDTIRSRCTSYNLKSVPDDDLEALVERVAEAEGMTLHSEVAGLIARQASGSARKALVFLSQINGVADKKEALRLLENGVGEEEQAIALARMVCSGKGFTWDNCIRLIKALEGESPEGVRLMIVNYSAKILENTASPEQQLAVLDAFRGPYNASEKWAPLYLAIGSLLFN